jgi:hypothetical protein
MCTTDGVPDATSSSSTSLNSTAKAPRTRAALADPLNSLAATSREAAGLGAALVSGGEIRLEPAAARAGLLPPSDAHDAGGHASSCACLAAPGQDGPA